MQHVGEHVLGRRILCTKEREHTRKKELIGDTEDKRT